MLDTEIMFEKLKKTISFCIQNYMCAVKRDKELLQWIETSTPLLQGHTLKTRIWWLLNGVSNWNDQRVRCKMCGQPIMDFDVPSIILGYKQTCGPVCRAKLAQQSSEEACMQKHGVKNSFQIKNVKDALAAKAPEMRAKAQHTKKLNHTFSTSEDESLALVLLRLAFPDVEQQHKDEDYPWMCDFYVPSKKMYIELNCSWTHGFQPWDNSDQKCIAQLEDWKQRALSSEYYANAIQTWTVRDTEKRKHAQQFGLNWHEVWSLEDLPRLLKSMGCTKLMVPPDKRRMKADWKWMQESDLRNKPLPLSLSRGGYVVKYFQQSVMLKRENELWQDQAVKEKLVANRCKWLSKSPDELTDLDLLDGFKRSGMHYGYSAFSPMWLKWFVQRYGCKRVYDPCGGWGHRMLGAAAAGLERYIYNDASPTVKSNVDAMVQHFGASNVTTHCGDAASWMPDEPFDAMFTCPPYFNVEKYECGCFASRVDFDAFLDSLFAVLEAHPECKVFGLCIREDLLGQHLDYVERFKLTVHHKCHLSSRRKHDEWMFVFKRA